MTVIFAVVALLAAGAFGLRAFLASDAGRAMIVRALPLYAPNSGLRVGAGRIEGNIFGTLRVHDLTLADPAGVFAKAPLIDLAWRPMTLLENRLSVRYARAAEMTVLRRPRLRPSADDRILPSIDIVVGRLTIGRLILAAPVTGRPETIHLDGSGEAVAGRAQVTLAAGSATGGDRIDLHLDARPDADRFDAAATIVAPAHGTLARLLGLPAALTATLGGRGTWRDWHGTAMARLGAAPLADLALQEMQGRVIVTGGVAPAPLLGGAAARAVAGGVRLRADGRLTGRVLTGHVAAASRVVSATLSGTADFSHEVIAAGRLDARLLAPGALLPSLSGRDITLAARIGGSFAVPVVDYTLASPRFAWGQTGFAGFRATGHVLARAPLVIPVAASAVRVDGVGADLAPLLVNLRVDGPLLVGHGAVSGARLAVRSAGASGTATVRLAFTGDFALGFDGTLPRVAVGDLGQASVAVRLTALPAGGGTRVTGTVKAVGTRIDSDLFRSVLAGAPVVTGSFTVAPDLAMTFADLRLASPGLSLAGSGSRDASGNVRIAARGTSRDYGPATVSLDGPVAAPTVDLALAAPGFGVTAATAHITPGPSGWTVAARGTTGIGPASAVLHLAPGGTAADVTATVAGATASGHVTIDAAGLAGGRLAVSGDRLAGTLVLAPAGRDQRGDLAVTADNVVLGRLHIGHGTVGGHIVAGPDGRSGDLHATLGSVRAGGVTVTTATATATLAGSGGSATLTASGSAGVPFTLALDAHGSANHVDLGGSATVDGRRLALDHRAVADRNGSVWQLAPVTLITPDGRAELAGSYGDGVKLSLRADNLGLSLLTLADPAFNFGGRVSGTVAVALPAAGEPTGTVSLRVAGLTRAGLASSSTPVDVAVNAALTPAAAALRAIIVSGGATVGRVQADVRLAATGALRDRLLAAPLFAQARFAGPAQALWALSGVEALDVRGPVTLALDAGGRLGDPRLTGTVTANGARVENTTLGTVVDNVAVDGRFNGSRLDLASFSGTIGKGGGISGSGTVDLSAERGFPLDVTARLDNAQAINRDDFQATMTGTLKLHSDGGGGTVGGALDIVRARYRLGRAATNADVPVLAVTERNAELLGRPPPHVAKPTQWRLDIALTARENFAVEGMGLTSFWRGALRVTGLATAPALAGRVQLVRGDYDFSGKRFSLTRGDVRFNGSVPPDPVIDIQAENTASGFTADLALTGTALHPDIRFSSTPALPEDEVLSRVLFGTSITTLSAPEAIQLAGALASLRSNGRGVGAVLDPFNTIRRSLRIDRLRALPADTTIGRKTAIAAGKYIGRRLYVELQTDAQGYSATSVEFALSRTFSILSTVATLGGTSASVRAKRDY